MPPIKTSVSGEEALFGSINDWLEANVPASTNGFTYFFDQALDPAQMPQVEVSQFSFFEPGDTALGGVVFPKNPTGHIQGKFNQAMLEINIRDDGSKHDDALQRVRKIRDLIEYALINAGVYDEHGEYVIFPGILVYTAGGVSTNTFARVMTEDSNAVVKTFYKPSPPESDIFRYQLFFKIEWVELV